MLLIVLSVKKQSTVRSAEENCQAVNKEIWVDKRRFEVIDSLFFATPKYLKLQNAFPKVAAGNSSFLHVSPA